MSLAYSSIVLNYGLACVMAGPYLASESFSFRLSFSDGFLNCINCNELEVPYLDVFSLLVKSPVWLKEAKADDGAHPTDGYAEFAALVQNWEAWLDWFTP